MQYIINTLKKEITFQNIQHKHKYLTLTSDIKYNYINNALQVYLTLSYKNNIIYTYSYPTKNFITIYNDLIDSWYKNTNKENTLGVTIFNDLIFYHNDIINYPFNDINYVLNNKQFTITDKVSLFLNIPNLCSFQEIINANTLLEITFNNNTISNMLVYEEA